MRASEVSRCIFVERRGKLISERNAVVGDLEDHVERFAVWPTSIRLRDDSRRSD